jgi:glycosyltransferase involved in cell wall biosynthesis
MTDAPALSVVVPAYNEASCIERTIAAVRAELDRIAASWEILVVDDGSADSTAALAGAAAAGDQRIRVIQAVHAGKGAAVRRGMLEARGTWRFLTDADLSTPAAELERFLAATGESSAPDVVIGSREATGSCRVGEPWPRHAVGRVFNWLVKLLVLRGIEDTQCGFKLFRGTAAERLFRQQTLDGFGFDVEVLFLARRAGLVVREMPVTWSYDPHTKVTYWSGLRGFLDVLRVRWNASTGVYTTADQAAVEPPVSRRWRAR